MSNGATDLTHELSIRGMTHHLAVNDAGEQIVTVYRKIDDNALEEVFECGTVRDVMAFLSGWEACAERYAVEGGVEE